MTLNLGRVRNLAAAGFAASCLLLSACDSAVFTCQVDCPVDASDLPNLIETATAAGNFTTLMAALESSGLSQVLADDTQSFTVFAPTDAAFAAFGDAELMALQADTEALSDTLLYHVLPGSVNAETAIGLAGTTIAMQNNKAAELTLDGETLMINNANVTTTDVAASNGIIHVIDAVLVPPAETIPVNLVQTATNAGDFTTLVSALQSSGLDQVLADDSQQYTVFAPTDAAFEALGQEAIDALLADSAALQSTLLYHVLPGAVNAETATSLAGNTITMQDGSSADLSLDGETLMINDANITATDITATNGIIHVIDAVLTPPNTDTTPATEDIAATLAGKADYSTLLANLQSSGLDAALADSAKTYTIFAPTNAAFEAASTEIQAALAADANALEAVLLGHVLPDSIVPAATALTLNNTEITMANGAIRTITVADSTVMIDGATVVETDIEASNGVIHGIDSVLLDATDAAAN